LEDKTSVHSVKVARWLHLLSGYYVPATLSPPGTINNTEQCGSRNINWTLACDAVFPAIEATSWAKEAFIRYSHHNKPCHVYTDASDRQRGADILQEPVGLNTKGIAGARAGGSQK
jgi:hypothetical protein